MLFRKEERTLIRMNKKFSLSKTHATMPGLEAEETDVWNPIKQVN